MCVGVLCAMCAARLGVCFEGFCTWEGDGSCMVASRHMMSLGWIAEDVPV